MNCDKTKEIILTDYLDGRLKGDALKEIEKHVSECSSCGELYKNAKDFAVSPLRNADKKQVPGHLYAKVLAKIRSNEQRRSFWDVIGARKVIIPTISVATAALLLIGVYIANYKVNMGTAITSITATTTNGIENITNLYYLTNGEQNNQSNVNFGSAAEEFFL